MGLLIVLYPFAEIYAFYKFIEIYSFMDALLLVVLSGFAGALIIRLLGPATLSSLQTDLSQGRIPANQLLHRSLVIIGGFLLFVPGIISDVMGALCILPGSRHLIALYIKHLVNRGLFKGRVFMSGFGFPGGNQRPGGFSRQHRPFDDHREERDAQVVDIEPLEITHKNLPPGDSGDSKS